MLAGEVERGHNNGVVWQAKGHATEPHGRANMMQTNRVMGHVALLNATNKVYDCKHASARGGWVGALAANGDASDEPTRANVAQSAGVSGSDQNPSTGFLHPSGDMYVK